MQQLTVDAPYAGDNMTLIYYCHSLLCMMSLCVRVSLVTTRRPAAQKRRAATSRNPLRQLAARGDLLSGYTQVRTDVAERELRRIKRQQSQSHPPLHPPTVSVTPPAPPPLTPTTESNERNRSYENERNRTKSNERNRTNKIERTKSNERNRTNEIERTKLNKLNRTNKIERAKLIERTNEGGHVSTPV